MNTQYTITLTQKDIIEINHLVDRQYAGMTCGWLPTAIAVTNVLKQISDQNIEELDNYDTDGTCPVCKAAEHEDND